MNLFRRKKSNPPPLSDIEQAPLSVFQADDEMPDKRTPQRDTTDAVDVAFVDVRGERDDDAPFGPELPDHVVAAPERERRKRRIRLGAWGTAKETLPEATEGTADALDPGDSAVKQPAASEQTTAVPAQPHSKPEKAKRWSFAKKPAVEPVPPAEETATAEAAEPVRQVKEASSSIKTRISGLTKRRAKTAKSTTNFPVRVLIGFLPEVTERDALSFALGVAEKHVENIENAYFDVFAHQGGFVYEVHEGGNGCAFVPAVLDYFDSLGPFRSEVEARMHIRTATRTVEVIRKPSQIEAVLLPESAGMQTTPEPAATQSMRLAMNKRTGLLVAGAGIFITGFFAAIIIGSFMRLVPADDVRQPQGQKLEMSELPAGQWATKLQNVPDGKYVKALRYDKKAKWRTENADVVEQPTADATQQPPVKPAGN